jgi:hypothetical protein
MKKMEAKALEYHVALDARHNQDCASHVDLDSPSPMPIAETVTPDRKIFCAHYSGCLDIALDRGWRGFTCAECQAFELEVIDSVTATYEAARCLAFVSVLVYGGAVPNRRKVVAVCESLAAPDDDILI